MNVCDFLPNKNKNNRQERKLYSSERIHPKVVIRLAICFLFIFVCTALYFIIIIIITIKGNIRGRAKYNEANNILI